MGFRVKQLHYIIHKYIIVTMSYIFVYFIHFASESGQKNNDNE